MRCVTFVAILVVAARAAHSQRADGNRAGVVVPIHRDTAVRAPAFATLGSGAEAAGSRAALQPYAPLISALVPGGGQLILGDSRFTGYAVVEVLGWWKYRKDTREQAAQERAYKELARLGGRANFSTALPDGDWTYYEAMRDRVESGVYSKNLVGPVEPETDTSTYNGHLWELALRTNPNAASALAQYERMAIRPEYRWSWLNANLQYDIFKRTTFKRDDAYYAAVQDLIVIGANHVISMVDAFATIRLRVTTDPSGRKEIGARIHW